MLSLYCLLLIFQIYFASAPFYFNIGLLPIFDSFIALRQQHIFFVLCFLLLTFYYTILPISIMISHGELAYLNNRQKRKALAVFATSADFRPFLYRISTSCARPESQCRQQFPAYIPVASVSAYRDKDMRRHYRFALIRI